MRRSRRATIDTAEGLALYLFRGSVGKLEDPVMVERDVAEACGAQQSLHVAPLWVVVCRLVASRWVRTRSHRSAGR